jgi:hypothetical protein
LDRGRVVLDLDDLADQLFVADADNLVHGGTCYFLGNNDLAEYGIKAVSCSWRLASTVVNMKKWINGR